MLALDQIDQMTRGRLGIADVPCPACGPDRRTAANRVRRVLRVWRTEPGFATFSCARCDLKGWASDRGASPPSPTRLAELRAEAEAHAAAHDAERRELVRRIVARRRPAAGTNVETYLRGPRAFGGRIPETIGFLPATERHPPAMIALFTIPTEPVLGTLAVDDEAVAGVHLTRLKPDGSGKDGDPAKIMIGRSLGTPIVLAPMNDLLGLVICEGIETGLSIAEATNCGVWAAGAAGRMPALADAVPAWADCVTIAGEADDAGQRGARALQNRLVERGLHVELSMLEWRAAA